MPKQKKMWDKILTVIMTLLSLLWIYPIVLILLNSLKIEGSFTTSTVFKLPTAETFAGLSNCLRCHQDGLPFQPWLQPCHHRYQCSADPAVLLHDRLVPHPREQ